MGNSEARLHKMGGQQNKKKLDKQVKATLERVNQLEVKSKPYQNAAIKLNMDEREKKFIPRYSSGQKISIRALIAR